MMKELRAMSKKRLEQLLGEEREALRVLHFRVAQHEETNVRLVRALRKRIAAILTLLQSKK